MEARFDLHIHSERSPDGRMSLDEIVARARATGLQGVAVCDHDRALTETWDAPDFLLIPGIELSTDQGHLLGLFVTEQIEARELDAAIDAVHACGGLAGEIGRRRAVAACAFNSRLRRAGYAADVAAEVQISEIVPIMLPRLDNLNGKAFPVQARDGNDACDVQVIISPSRCADLRPLTAGRQLRRCS
jgi:hypothetical protein